MARDLKVGHPEAFLVDNFLGPLEKWGYGTFGERGKLGGRVIGGGGESREEVARDRKTLREEEGGGRRSTTATRTKKRKKKAKMSNPKKIKNGQMSKNF